MKHFVNEFGFATVVTFDLADCPDIVVRASAALFGLPELEALQFALLLGGLGAGNFGQAAHRNRNWLHERSLQSQVEPLRNPQSRPRLWKSNFVEPGD